MRVITITRRNNCEASGVDYDMGVGRLRMMIARKIIGLICCIVLGVCLVPCSAAKAMQCDDANYRKTDKGWSFQGKLVEGADFATFRVLTGPDPYLGSIPCGHDSGYAVDRFHVYWYGAIIAGADPNTFSYLQFGYSLDTAHVYYRREIVSGADPRTFAHIDGEYFRDSAHVFLRGAAVKEAHPENFSVLSKSWFLQDRLARDAVHVFFGATIVYQADPKDLVDLSGPYWMSNQTIFFKETPLKEADATSFRTASKGEQAFWAEDKAHYFLLSGQSLNKTDCREVGTDILACKVYVWARGQKFSRFDSASLHYLGGFPPKHCVYEGWPAYQDRRGVYFISNDGIERFLHSRGYPRIEHLDKTNADRLCRLGGTVDVWPDGWLDQVRQKGSKNP